MTNLIPSRLTRNALAAVACIGVALAGAGSAHAATPAGYTDPDRGICSDGQSTPPGAYLRTPDGLNHPLVFLTETGYNGSQDHFYIESDYTKSDGAHWYRGYGYDVDNNTKTYGDMLDTWIARSGGGC